MMSVRSMISLKLNFKLSAFLMIYTYRIFTTVSVSKKKRVEDTYKMKLLEQKNILVLQLK